MFFKIIFGLFMACFILSAVLGIFGAITGITFGIFGALIGLVFGLLGGLIGLFFKIIFSPFTWGILILYLVYKFVKRTSK